MICKLDCQGGSSLGYCFAMLFGVLFEVLICADDCTGAFLRG